MQIYIHHNGQQLGPFTEAEVRAQLASGAISIEDHVWWEGQANWVPLGQSSIMAAPPVVPPLTPFVTPPAAVPGSPAVTYAQSVALPQTSGLAITSLVCGLIGLPGLFCYCMGVVPSIIAVITGHLALNEIKKAPVVQGKGMAITGLITGYLGIAFFALGILCVIFFASTGNFDEIFKKIQEQQAIIEKKAQDTQKQDGSSPDSTTNAAPVVDP